MATPRIDLRDFMPNIVSDQHRALSTMGNAILAAWSAEARAKLGTSSQRIAAYEKGLSVHVTNGNKVRVVLSDVIPNILEQGMGPGGIGTQGAYDQRLFSLKPTTKNIRRSKKGNLYLNVPFHLTDKEIVALGGNRALRALRKLDAATTPRLKGSTRRINLRRPGLGPGYGQRGRGHSHDSLEGVRKQNKTYAKSTQGTYVKWRVMSQGGRPWMSAGVRARNLAQAVSNRIPQILQAVR
jgi:hypothetical protein